MKKRREKRLIWIKAPSVQTKRLTKQLIIAHTHFTALLHALYSLVF